MTKMICYACLLLVYFALMPLCINSAPHNSRTELEPDPIALRAQIESVEPAEITLSDVTVIVKLKLELLNIGTSPVILLSVGPPNSVGFVLTKSSDGYKSRDYLVMQYAGPGNDFSQKWSILRKRLNQPSPPSDVTRILKPNESWQFEDTIYIQIPTETGIKSLPRVSKDAAEYSLVPKTESWEAIQKASPVWLSALYEVWPFNVEPRGLDRSTKLKFGHQLRKRWKRDGFLLLNPLYSDPIKLDLQNIKQG